MIRTRWRFLLAKEGEGYLKALGGFG